MMYLRPDQPGEPFPRADHTDSDATEENAPEPARAEESSEPSRLNLLLSYGGWREGGVVDQLPRLLKPMGIISIRVHSGEEASEVIRFTPIHIAVVDLALPLNKSARQSDPPGGARILQILRRLDEPPPTIVVRPPQSAARESARSLSDALREGAFAVLDRPLHMETMLETLRRALRRHYKGHWPLGEQHAAPTRN